jgi:hypothetical protein
MATQFGFLSKLEFLQNLASALIARINSAVIHNLEKYIALKKVHYLSAIEDINGDYLEFGVFTGSSFCHSIRCCKKLLRLNPKIQSSRFFGFDSFAGFGVLDAGDKHPFYTDANFASNYSAVNKRVLATARKIFEVKLIPGYFSDSLTQGAAHLGISSARIVFIDCDTYSSANEALTFCGPIVQEGTFVILDDYFSYRGSQKRGVARAFSEFISTNRLKVRQLLTYGMGGAVFVISETQK